MSFFDTEEAHPVMPLRKFPLLHLWRSAVETGVHLDQRERAGSQQLPSSVQKKTSISMVTR
jgi:predicted PolB exonuclease-like 3'-5' exonuclease